MKTQICNRKYFICSCHALFGDWNRLRHWMHVKCTLNVLMCVSRMYRSAKVSAVPQSLTYMDDEISNSGWYTPEDFRARLRVFTRRLHLYEACTTKRHSDVSWLFAYNWDKSLLVFRGKCFRSASRCATYSSTFCTTVVSEEIVTFREANTASSGGNRKISLVISR